MLQPSVLSGDDILKWLLQKFNLRLCMYGKSGDLLEAHGVAGSKCDDMMVSVAGIRWFGWGMHCIVCFFCM